MTDDAVKRMADLVKKGVSERAAAVKVGKEMSISSDALRNKYRREGTPEKIEKWKKDKKKESIAQQSRRLSFTMASDFAEMAVTSLARIPPDDRNAIRSLNWVSQWIVQRKKEIKEINDGRSNHGNK